MRRNFYVDDCLRSVSTEVKAKEQIEGLRQVCAKGGFRLTKFICNRRSVLESIPEEERSKDVKTLDLNYDELPIERVLGVQWWVVRMMGSQSGCGNSLPMKSQDNFYRKLANRQIKLA